MMNLWAGGRPASQRHNWQQMVRDFVLLATIAVTLIALSNASDATDAIQQQRRETIFNTCWTQNMHHLAAIRQLAAEPASWKPSRVAIIRLINTLAPYEKNCLAVTWRATS